MELPSVLFEEVTGHAPVGTQGCSRERRQALRVPLRERVALSIIREGRPAQPLWVRVRDISASGIGILHTDAIAPDAALLIGLPRCGGKLAWVYGFAVRCQSLGSNLFLIGVVFSCILDLQQALPSPRKAPQSAPAQGAAS